MSALCPLSGAKRNRGGASSIAPSPDDDGYFDQIIGEEFAFRAGRFEFTNAIHCTYAASTSAYALTIGNSHARITTLPANHQKIQLTNYTTAHFGTAVTTTGFIYGESHVAGRDGSVNLIRNGAFLATP